MKLTDLSRVSESARAAVESTVAHGKQPCVEFGAGNAFRCTEEVEAGTHDHQDEGVSVPSTALACGMSPTPLAEMNEVD
jgi:hypothetical protein